MHSEDRFKDTLIKCDERGIEFCEDIPADTDQFTKLVVDLPYWRNGKPRKIYSVRDDEGWEVDSLDFYSPLVKVNCMYNYPAGIELKKLMDQAGFVTKFVGTTLFILII